MKKVVFLAVLMFVMAVCAFAQSYTVQSVTGRVQQDKSGNRVEVKAGETLSGDTVIYTGIGASIVVKEGDKTYTIKAARNGKVSELATSSSSVQINGNVATTNTDAVSRTTTKASTASARASDAAADADIAAE
jgi:phage gp45-like